MSNLNDKNLRRNKEEKALKLAKQIKEIKDKMKKEGETVEGYKKNIRIAERNQKNL